MRLHRIHRPGVVQANVNAVEWLEMRLLMQTEGVSQAEAIRLALREACHRRGLRQVALEQLESGIDMPQSAEYVRAGQGRQSGRSTIDG